MTVTLGVPKTKPDVTCHYGLLLTGRTLKGSLFGGWKPKSDIPTLIDMYLKQVNALVILTIQVSKIVVEISCNRHCIYSKCGWFFFIVFTGDQGG